LATIGPSLQAVGISELASWQAVLMYTVETVNSHCDHAGLIMEPWQLWMQVIALVNIGQL